jgi:hypothetical protein
VAVLVLVAHDLDSEIAGGGGGFGDAASTGERVGCVHGGVLPCWGSSLWLCTAHVVRMWCKPLVINQKQALACANCGARYWD